MYTLRCNLDNVSSLYDVKKLIVPDCCSGAFVLIDILAIVLNGSLVLNDRCSVYSGFVF